MDAAQFKSFLDEIQRQRAEDNRRHEENEKRLLEAIKILQEQPTAAQNPATSSSTFKNLSDSMLEFSYDPDMNLTFDAWYRRYESVFTTEAAELSEATKIRLLTGKLKNADFEQFANAIMPTKTHELTFDEAITKLKLIFGHRQSKFSLRKICFGIVKEDAEDFAHYAARVNKHCERFDLKNCTVDEFKAQIFVNGVKSSHDSLILEKLLMKLDSESANFASLKTQADNDNFVRLKLQDLVDEADRIISLKQDKSSVVEPSKSEVFAVKQQKFYKKNDSTTSSFSSGPLQSSQPPSPCLHCGGVHWHKHCLYKDKICSDCQKTGHKAGYCTMKRSRPPFKRERSNPELTRRVQRITNVNNVDSQRKYIVPNVNGLSVKLQLDTASDITIISRTNWAKLGKPALNNTDKQAGSASGDSIPLLGSFPCVIKLNGKEKIGECYVSTLQLNLFGIDWITVFDLWTVPLNTICNKVQANSADNLLMEAKAKYPLLFSEGLGCCTKTKASLTLKAGAKPVYRNARPVPHSARQTIAAELERLQHLGVISPVEYSESAAPIVVVKKKDGRIRICADYSTGLNNNLEPNKYPLPTPDQIFAKLAGKTVFSSIDLSDAFFQVALDEQAQKLMTINTHVGLFRVNRLQQGVKTAPGIFQQIVDTMLSGTSTFGFIDDMICAGIDENDHKKQLFNTLQRLQDYGFRLHIDKCKFGVSSIEFCGHTVSKNGIQPHPGKLNSIQDLPKPANIQQLRSFLGSVNYYGKFVKGMKDLRGPLDDLLRKDIKFEWTQQHDNAFLKLKKVLSSELCLTHFDPEKKIVLATDASEYGMGAVLMHEFTDGTLHPIMHFSATFNTAERNYPQMHKEARALVFGLKKSHYYLAGRRFTIHIDHKPLLAIFNPKSGIPMYTAARLQRYAINVLSYDFDIQYVNTDNFGYADVISRLMSNHTKPDEDTVIASIQVCLKDDDSFDVNCFAVESAYQLPVTFERIQSATAACSTLQKVLHFTKNDNWPQKRSQIIGSGVTEYFQHRHHFTVQQGCVFFGERIIIPKIHREQILSELHQGHPGECRMKLLAAGKVFWPNITSDIGMVVKTCDICASVAKTPVKCTLQPWPIPTEPWSRIHVDYAGPIDGHYFLVIVDAYSKWPEVFQTTSTTTAKTIELIMNAFSQHGLCDTIVSDNGAQFASQEFQKFCKSLDITHVRTAPYSPQSNGQAERFVDLLKTGLRKATGNINQKLQEFLFCYRRTPSYNLGLKSPSELLNSRPMKTRLDRLKSKAPTQCRRNTKMAEQFDDHHGAKFKEFNINDPVYFKLHLTNDKWEWTPAIVIKRLGAVNYEIRLSSPSNQRIIKAHSNQLKFRHTRNEFSELFEIPEWPETIEPIIIPQPTTKRLEEDHPPPTSLFQDDEDQQGSNEHPVPEVRRSSRATRGQLPRWHREYQRF